jgi:hypothetical protein
MFLGPWVQRENYPWPEGSKKLDNPGICHTNVVAARRLPSERRK